jgi:hypothetical protein
MSKKLSDYFSVPLNTSYIIKEIGQGLRDQIIPDKISDILSRVATTIDNKPLVDSSKSHLAVVVRMLTDQVKPPVGSIPWIRNLDAERPTSDAQISSVCYVVSYDRVNIFNKLPNNIGDDRTRLDQILEKDLILAYVEGEPFRDKPIKQGSIVEISFVNWPKEAKIIAIQTKNTPFPVNNEGIQNAFANADGMTIGSETSAQPISRISGIPRDKLCKNANKLVDLASKIRESNTGLSIEPAALAAIKAVETGASTDFNTVRFEPHKFNEKKRNRVEAMKFTDNGKGFSSVLSETNRAAFEEAYRRDPAAAIKSTSFGSFQVIPTNEILKELKIGSNKFLEEYEKNPEKISNDLLIAWFKYNPQALEQINNGDFTEFVKRYNGKKNINKYKPLFVQAIFRTRTECPELNANSALSAGGGALTYAKNVADDSEESTPPAGPLPQG